jgi:hypothetical protein
MKTRYHLLACALLWLSPSACDQQTDKAGHGRSDAVASASREMSGPALFSSEQLSPALQALRAKASGKWLRLEIRARELTLQAEDTGAPGSVVELHYRDGKVGEPEHATVRGKGQLVDNLFDAAELKLEGIAELSREAVRRIDAESGTVDVILVRRNLPDSDDVRLRVYVASPRKNGYMDADHTGQPL